MRQLPERSIKPTPKSLQKRQVSGNINSRSSEIAYQRRLNQDREREELERAIAQRQAALSANNFPVASLPKTPGIDAPLPRQNVMRSGLPLMPLGSEH